MFWPCDCTNAKCCDKVWPTFGEMEDDGIAGGSAAGVFRIWFGCSIGRTEETGGWLKGEWVDDKTKSYELPIGY